MQWIDMLCGYVAPSKLGVFVIQHFEAMDGSRETKLVLLNASGRHELGEFDEQTAAKLAELMAEVG